MFSTGLPSSGLFRDPPEGPRLLSGVETTNDTEMKIGESKIKQQTITIVDFLSSLEMQKLLRKSLFLKSLAFIPDQT